MAYGWLFRWDFLQYLAQPAVELCRGIFQKRWTHVLVSPACLDGFLAEQNGYGVVVHPFLMQVTGCGVA